MGEKNLFKNIAEAVKDANPLGIITDSVKKAADIADMFIKTPDEREAAIARLIELNNADVADARENETKRDTSENSSWLSKNVHELIALMVSSAWILSWWIPAVVAHGDVKDIVLVIMGYLFGRTMPNMK